MISIAMTTYNGELYVEKQLASLLKQTRKPDEVIIVDDCSSDNTVKIIEEFIKKNELKNWMLSKSVINKGFIQAFYEAISKTNGDIIFFCDHDDIWLPNKIEIMSELMLANPNILSLTSGFEKIDSDDKEIVSINNPFSSNNNLIRKRIKPNKCVQISPFRVVAYNISPGCTCAFRSTIKDPFSKLNDENMGLVHDWKINLIAALMDGLYFINTPTTLYRLHHNNSLGMNRDCSIDSRIKACSNGFKERTYMANIIEKLVKENIIEQHQSNQKLMRYIRKLKKIMTERQKALIHKDIIGCVTLIFKFNLFKNRIFESIAIDIYALTK